MTTESVESICLPLVNVRATTTQNPGGSEGQSNNTIYSILLTLSKLLHPYCTSLPTAMMLTSYLVRRINSPPDATHRSMCAISSILPSLHSCASKRLLVTAFWHLVQCNECSDYKKIKEKEKNSKLTPIPFSNPSNPYRDSSVNKKPCPVYKKLTLSAHEFCKERHYFRHFTPSR